jgi:hypothetical protein
LFTDFKDVPLRLGDSNFVEFRPLAGKRGGPILFETLVNQKTDVFGGGNQAREGVDFLVQILQVEFGENTLSDQAVERGGIDGSARSRINGTTDADIENVVMSVSEGIVAFPEQAAVFFFRDTGDVEAVRG